MAAAHRGEREGEGQEEGEGRMPEYFMEWLKEHNISPSLYLSPSASLSLRRYIRIPHSSSLRSPAASPREIYGILHTLFHGQIQPTVIPSVYSLPSSFPLLRHSLALPSPHSPASFLGLDLASALAAAAIDAGPGERVIEMCCSPGGKYMNIRDNMLTAPHVPHSPSSSHGLLVGVDCSRDRMNLMKKTLQQYKYWNKHTHAHTHHHTPHPHRHSSPSPASLDPSNSPDISMYLFLGDATHFAMTPLLIQQKYQHIKQQSKYVPLIELDQHGDGKMILNAKQQRARKRKARQNVKNMKKKAGRQGEGEEGEEEDGEEREGDRRTSEEHNANPDSPPPVPSSSPSFPSSSLFTRVLVDAECSHDGSIKHIQKLFNIQHTANDTDNANMNSSSSSPQTNAPIPPISSSPSPPLSLAEFQSKFIHYSALPALLELQYNLLLNGFRLLAPHGVLIYSTCSFMRCQNESIIERLLMSQTEARLVPVFGVQGQGENEHGHGQGQGHGDDASGLNILGDRYNVRESIDPNTQNAQAAHRMNEEYGRQLLMKSESTGHDEPIEKVRPIIYYSRGQPFSSLSPEATALRYAPPYCSSPSPSSPPPAPACIRFDPIISGTSGLFMAKITKIPIHDNDKK